ncbi:DUF3515 domain-containing protein [Streptomyces sp. HNM0663]|uniref:DUF3515 domain-containing protein n=1 Tax=Streptomyces chengmaiensis TaxID=3040919 RepID=A0ABT6HRQ4_9ACTN|nr:DUF3515 domain-containing protein [Streptomyces chengmaiensis]MDH2391394.1 DUF3515 domain-containing protein [Streptomyces chengmaiensis]
MTFSRRRPLCLPAAAATVLVSAAVGCSPTDATVRAAVPSPPPAEAALCRALDEELPESVAGQSRRDPQPASEYTAAWGDGAIVLRCGVPRPQAMDDPQSQGLEANGVGWLVEERTGEEGAGPRFTTTYRTTYVEVALDERYAHDAGPLAGLAEAVEKTIPASL